MEKYEHPGEKINSKAPTKEYKDNYDKIFGEKESWIERREQNKFRETEEYRNQVLTETAATLANLNKDEHCCGKCSPCSGNHTDKAYD